jgi:hypothetical protein
MAQVSDAVHYVRDKLRMSQVAARLLDEIEEAAKGLIRIQDSGRGTRHVMS